MAHATDQKSGCLVSGQSMAAQLGQITPVGMVHCRWPWRHRGTSSSPRAWDGSVCGRDWILFHAVCPRTPIFAKKLRGWR